MDKSEVSSNENLELGDKKKENKSSSKGLTVVGIMLLLTHIVIN